MKSWTLKDHSLQITWWRSIECARTRWVRRRLLLCWPGGIKRLSIPIAKELKSAAKRSKVWTSITHAQPPVYVFPVLEKISLWSLFCGFRTYSFEPPSDSWPKAWRFFTVVETDKFSLTVMNLNGHIITPTARHHYFSHCQHFSESLSNTYFHMTIHCLSDGLSLTPPHFIDLAEPTMTILLMRENRSSVCIPSDK